MSGKPSILACCGMLIALIGIASAHAAPSEPSRPTDAQEATDAQRLPSEMARLVRDLGNKSFSVRAKATRLLTEQGASAIPALEKGIESSVREVRIRSGRILNVVRRRVLDQKLNKFVLERNSKHNIPGWRHFSALVGDSGDSRALFVAMHKEEPFLMRMADGDVALLAPEIVKRVDSIRQNRRYSYNQLKLGTITALFFLSTVPEIELPRQTSSSIGSFGNYYSFRSGLTKSGRRQVLRSLLGKWVKTGKDLSYAFSYAIQFDLPEGLALAERTLASTSPQKAYERQMAILTIVRMGNQRHVMGLEALLKDKTHVTGSTTRNRVQYKTQIRDVALAAVMVLSDEDPKKFGFSRITYGSNRVFHTSSIGFSTEEARAKVFKAWEDRKHPGKSLLPSTSQPPTTAPKKGVSPQTTLIRSP